MIRVVFMTHSYQNLRGERFALLTLTAAEDEQACHAAIDRAFAAGDDPAATCLAACRLARETPGIAVGFDDASGSLSIGVSTMLEGARLTSPQLLAMLDKLVITAEDWHARLHTGATIGRRLDSRIARRRAM